MERDGGYGWIIVAASILINGSLQALMPCFVLVFKDRFDEWGITTSQLAFIQQLQFSLFCLFGFLTGPFLKKIGMIYVAWLGTLLACSGFYLTGFAMSYTYVLVTVSVLMGIGQGIALPVTYYAIYLSFSEKLTIAASLIATSVSMSTTFMPKACEVLLTHLGKRYTLLVPFSVSLLSFAGSVLLRPVKDKEELLLEHRPASEEARPNENGAAAEEMVPLKKPTTKFGNDLPKESPQNLNVFMKHFYSFDLDLVKNTPFVLTVLGLGVSFAAEFSIVLLLQPILRDLTTLEESDIAKAIDLQNVAYVVGTSVVPILNHFSGIPNKFVYAGALLVAGFGRTVLTIWPQQKILVFAVMVLIGLAKGTRLVFQLLILPKYVPIDKLSTANGLYMLFTGSMYLIISPLLDKIHDLSGTYANSLHAATVLSLCCVVLFIFETDSNLRHWTTRKDSQKNDAYL